MVQIYQIGVERYFNKGLFSSILNDMLNWRAAFLLCHSREFVHQDFFPICILMILRVRFILVKVLVLIF